MPEEKTHFNARSKEAANTRIDVTIMDLENALEQLRALKEAKDFPTGRVIRTERILNLCKRATTEAGFLHTDAKAVKADANFFKD